MYESSVTGIGSPSSGPDFGIASGPCGRMRRRGRIASQWPRENGSSTEPLQQSTPSHRLPRGSLSPIKLSSRARSGHSSARSSSAARRASSADTSEKLDSACDFLTPMFSRAAMSSSLSPAPSSSSANRARSASELFLYDRWRTSDASAMLALRGLLAGGGAVPVHSQLSPMGSETPETAKVPSGSRSAHNTSAAPRSSFALISGYPVRSLRSVERESIPYDEFAANGIAAIPVPTTMCACSSTCSATWRDAFAVQKHSTRSASPARSWRSSAPASSSAACVFLSDDERTATFGGSSLVARLRTSSGSAHDAVSGDSRCDCCDDMPAVGWRAGSVRRPPSTPVRVSPSGSSAPAKPAPAPRARRSGRY